jgi:hypothetical protein
MLDRVKGHDYVFFTIRTFAGVKLFYRLSSRQVYKANTAQLDRAW